MNDITVIVFGATGDLARRKLFPALYHLIAQKKIKKIGIVGAALTSTSVEKILEGVRPFIGDVDETLWRNLHEQMIYVPVDVRKTTDFKTLQTSVTAFEKKLGLSGNRLIYLATSSEFFCTITQHLAVSGIATRRDERAAHWNRIVYEKPFGNDLESALAINACIEEYFNEHQIYRIDHFLTKELVSNIALIRFTNCVFEPLWNNRYIDQVQIIVSEEIGIEQRGAFYDKYGALADVMQNHVLELLALIAMESPEQLTGDYVRSKRVNVLANVKVVDGILGQYEGYTKEPHVAPDSNTETFAALMLRVDNPRWAGVPFYLKTGKCLAKKETVIHIKFKTVDCLLTHSCPLPANWLTIQIFPDEKFSLTLNMKKPGIKDEVVPVAMEFCHSCVFAGIAPQAYEVLLSEVIQGEQSVSVRFDEIEYAWRIIRAVHALHLPVITYSKKSMGPNEINTFEQKHGMRWRS